MFDQKILDLSKKCAVKLEGLNWTIATAESLTSGLIASALTQNPGASKYFLGSIVAYQDRIKRDIIGVDPELLLTNGAVDKEVAFQMALNVKNKFNSSVSLSSTGFAGPEGECVGLVYIGLVTPMKKIIEQFHFQTDTNKFTRSQIQRLTVLNALYLLAKNLE